MASVSTDRIVRTLTRTETFLTRDVALFQQRLSELDAQIDPRAVPIRQDDFHCRVLNAFEDSREACREFENVNGHDPAVIRDMQAGFRHETDFWFDRSWIAHRARTKPSGFSGDFDMLIKLYEQVTPARGLGGYLDLCILDLPLARAVRTRLRAVREFLLEETARRQKDVRILDLACGPCREFVNWPEGLGEGQVEILAMDNDPRAIEWVDAHVTPNMPGSTRLQTTRYNALRTRSAAATTRKFGRFDIIYSVGLFDYLTDDHLIPILGALRDTLNEGGVLYIAFKDTTRYDKTPYQWHLDWFFYQRTQEDCLRLYEAAGFNTAAVDMTRDDTGIIMNFISRKETAGFVRKDVPETASAQLRKHQPPVTTPSPTE